MNKKLLAGAVAGALASPTLAFAQSSVTISGLFKGGWESMKYGSFTRAGNDSAQGFADDSSRIIFNVVEELGNGLQAIGQIDNRFNLESGAIVANGNTWVGLRRNHWGRLYFGRQDLHYLGRGSDMTVKGSLRSDSVSILAFVANPGGPWQPIANATRTPNVLHYTTPSWGPFSAIIAYSSSPAGANADIGAGSTAGTTSRKGRAWNIAPTFEAGNWVLGYSYWNSRNDLSTSATVGATSSATGNSIATGDQRGDRLFGTYSWGGFKIGLAWDHSKITGASSGGTLADRTAWSLSASYTWGPHSIHFHYDKARKDNSSATTAGSVQALNGDTDSSAKMWALSYACDLSKRTSLALTYARIDNAAGANYNFYMNTERGVANASAAIGEKPTLWAVTMRHAF